MHHSYIELRTEFLEKGQFKTEMGSIAVQQAAAATRHIPTILYYVPTTATRNRSNGFSKGQPGLTCRKNGPKPWQKIIYYKFRGFQPTEYELGSVTGLHCTYYLQMGAVSFF